jgi:hypothetical protein
LSKSGRNYSAEEKASILKRHPGEARHRNLIVYFKRFKFPGAGHLSSNLDANNINDTFIA